MFLTTLFWYGVMFITSIFLWLTFVSSYFNMFVANQYQEMFTSHNCIQGMPLPSFVNTPAHCNSHCSFVLRFVTINVSSDVFIFSYDLK